MLWVLKRTVSMRRFLSTKINAKTYFLENDFLTPLQSGFIPGDSTVNQQIYLYNTFCKAFDVGIEVRNIFCDISKAFDRVSHTGLIHKT